MVTRTLIALPLAVAVLAAPAAAQSSKRDTVDRRPTSVLLDTVKGKDLRAARDAMAQLKKRAGQHGRIPAPLIPKTFEAFKEGLKVPDTGLRRFVVMGLEDFGRVNPKYDEQVHDIMEQLLVDGDATIRCTAARLLAEDLRPELQGLSVLCSAGRNSSNQNAAMLGRLGYIAALARHFPERYGQDKQKKIDQAVLGLGEAIISDDQWGRVLAYHGLGLLGSEAMAARPHLEDAALGLIDEETTVMATATLLRMGVNDKELRDQLRQKGPAHALGLAMTGVPTYPAEPVIRDLLERVDISNLELSAMMGGIGRLGKQVPDVLPIILKDSRAGIRGQAMYGSSLGRAPIDELRPAIEAGFLAEKDPGAIGWACSAMSVVGEWGTTLKPKIRQRLSELLMNNSPAREAAFVLVRGGDADLRALVEAGSHPATRVHVAEVVRIAPDIALPGLVEQAVLVSASKDEKMKQAALHALTSLGADGAPLLCNMAMKKGKNQAAAKALLGQLRNVIPGLSSCGANQG
ncbi:MAG: hypothetical protein AAF533_20800 [Acidobacteriota bacterium]